MDFATLVAPMRPRRPQAAPAASKADVAARLVEVAQDAYTQRLTQQRASGSLHFTASSVATVAAHGPHLALAAPQPTPRPGVWLLYIHAANLVRGGS